MYRKISKVVKHYLVVGTTIAGICALVAQAAAVPGNSLASVRIILTIDSKTYSRNGESLTLDVPPYISQEGRTMVPIRFIADGFGAKSTWDDSQKTSIIELNGKTTYCTVGEKLPDNMGTPVIKNDRLFVPIRYIATSLGADVNWSDRERKVIITTDISTEYWVDYDVVLKTIGNLKENRRNVVAQQIEFIEERQTVHAYYDARHSWDIPTVVVSGKVYVSRDGINNFYNLFNIPLILIPSEIEKIELMQKEYKDNPNAFINIDEIWNKILHEAHTDGRLGAGIDSGNATTDIGVIRFHTGESRSDSNGVGYANIYTIDGQQFVKKADVNPILIKHGYKPFS